MSRILILAITLKVEGAKQEKGGSFRSDLSLPADVLFTDHRAHIHHDFLRITSIGSPQAWKEDALHLRGLEIGKDWEPQCCRVSCATPSDTILCMHFSICPYLILNNNILHQHLHQEGLNLTRWLPSSVIKIRGCCFRRSEPVQSWVA